MGMFKSSVVVLLTALLWVVLYQLNMVLFHKLLFSTFVTWIFIPQGLRLIAVIVFAELGVLGLFFGAIVTYYLNGFTIGNPYILALISAINPYFAVATSRYLLKLDNLFTELTASKLLFISLISALFNSGFHQIYLHMRTLAGFGSDAFVMFYGDFFGTLIVLMLMSLTIKYLKYSYKRPT
jgi:hypothetical protein